MYKEIIKLLRCPICHEEVDLLYGTELGEEVIEGKLICSNAHQWRIHHGVVNFGSEEQSFANNWSETYKKEDYEELDRQLWDSLPDNLKDLYTRAKEYLLQDINSRKPNILIDIATGRGMLLMDMVRSVDKEVHIICTDLSFDVLRYDRIKTKKLNSKIKVSFIACDASNMPFKDGVSDLCTSFFGITNMMNYTQKGIEEANRILKADEYLLNTSIIIEEESRGYETLKDYLAELSMDECKEFAIESGFQKYHFNGGFVEVRLEDIGSSIGQKNEHDLIPFQGEWFKIVVAACRK